MDNTNTNDDVQLQAAQYLDGLYNQVFVEKCAAAGYNFSSPEEVAQARLATMRIKYAQMARQEELAKRADHQRNMAKQAMFAGLDRLANNAMGVQTPNVKQASANNEYIQTLSQLAADPKVASALDALNI